MPTLNFKHVIIEIDPEKTLRSQLLEAGLSPHNDQSVWLNCRGLGTCGTCAIRILHGDCTEPTSREKWRLNFPPFKNGLSHGFRLACQTRLLTDGMAEKGTGFWGENIK
ncbi:MAG: 2Fe-2S iron-sulfur cluster-binding protein [Thermaurantimonas sp.]